MPMAATCASEPRANAANIGSPQRPPSRSAAIIGSSTTPTSAATVEQASEIEQVHDVSFVHDLGDRFGFTYARLFESGVRNRNGSRHFFAIDRDEPPPTRVDDEQH